MACKSCRDKFPEMLAPYLTYCEHETAKHEHILAAQNAGGDPGDDDEEDDEDAEPAEREYEDRCAICHGDNCNC